MAKGAYIGVPIIPNPGPFSNTTSWVPNQTVTLSVNSGALRVVSGQSSSTPGAYTDLLGSIPSGTTVSLTYTIRGNVKVCATFWGISYGQSTLATEYYQLTDTFQTFTLTGSVSALSDRFYFFMSSPTTSSWFEISEINLFYNTARKIKKSYIGVDGKARKIKKAYIGVNGVAKLFWSGGIELSQLSEGSIVKINENGTPAEFYVAKHNYEPDLNGYGRTLLVRKDNYTRVVRESGTVSWSIYPSSYLNSWFNNTYKSYLSKDVQAAIGTTKYRYSYRSSSASVTPSTASASIFTLSLAEYNITQYYQDGSALPIYATLDDISHSWSRTSDHGWEYHSYCVASGSYYHHYTDETAGARPCFTLPSNALFDEQTMLFIG